MVGKRPVRLSDRKKVPPAPKRPVGALWTGPGGGGPQGGVTQSLIGRYLGCKERFRLRVVDGWAPADRFEPRMEFGNMWHAMEEALAGEVRHFGEHVGTTVTEDALEECTKNLLTRYQMQQDEIVHWAGIAGALFPEYVRHWAEHPDVTGRTPLLQEQVFDASYELPSGRTVRLRGKWDSVDLIDGQVWIQENKTKSKVDSVKIARQCTFDLQSMFYLVALRHEYDRMGWAAKGPITGVRYNVIRRPAHKTVESAMKKFGEDSRNGRIGEWFGRWQVLVDEGAIKRFRRSCLDPVLENLADDYEWWHWCSVRSQTHSPWEADLRAKEFPHHRARHFRYPFGVYNPLEEAGGTDLDALLDTGSTAGLRRLDDLFPELAPT